MRIFVQHHNASPEESVRQPLDILLEAGISAEGGGTINDRAVILIDAAHIQEAIAALNKTGMLAAIE